MLRLVSNNKWVMLNQESTDGVEIYHKEYNNNIHGVVFISEGMGNSVLLDSNDNILSMRLSDICDYPSLQKICDQLKIEVTKAV